MGATSFRQQWSGAARKPHHRINPWVTRPATPEDAPTAPPAAPPAGPLPQPGIATPAPDQQLPRRQLSRDQLLIPVWWVGAHGGAGETTLEQLLPGSRAADHAWPVSPDRERPARTMLLARTNYSGLVAAQRALRDWASGAVPAELDGLVLIADAPGKPPKDLRPLTELLESASPGRTWQLPWEPDWRVGRVNAENASPQAKQLIAQYRKDP